MTNILICFFQNIPCRAEEPCRLFTVSQARSTRPEETTALDICDCPAEKRCPKIHTEEKGVYEVPNSFKGIRSFSAKCSSWC